MVDLSVHDMHLAGRTQAVAARMREIDAGAECGIEDGLSFLDGHARPQWLDGEFVCHSRQGFGNSALGNGRSEEPTSELQSLMRNSYAVFCLKKKNTQNRTS